MFFNTKIPVEMTLETRRKTPLCTMRFCPRQTIYLWDSGPLQNSFMSLFTLLKKINEELFIDHTIDYTFLVIKSNYTGNSSSLSVIFRMKGIFVILLFNFWDCRPGKIIFALYFLTNTKSLRTAKFENKSFFENVNFWTLFSIFLVKFPTRLIDNVLKILSLTR